MLIFHTRLCVALDYWRKKAMEHPLTKRRTKSRLDEQEVYEMSSPKLRLGFRHLPLTIALFLISTLLPVVSSTAAVSQASQAAHPLTIDALSTKEATAEAPRLGWKLPPPPHDFAWYRSTIGFNAPTDPNARLSAINRQ